MDLIPGQTVTIKVRNPVWPMRRAYASYMHIPEFNEFTGTIVEAHKAIGSGQIGITAHEQYNPEFSLRVIDIDRIVGFEDSAEAAQAKSEYKTWTVKGSKGSEYLVTQERGQYSCTCPGFGFRRACKHVDEIKEEIGK